MCVQRIIATHQFPQPTPEEFFCRNRMICRIRTNDSLVSQKKEIPFKLSLGSVC